MEIERILARFEPKPELLLEILHAVQEAHPKRYLTDEALERVAAYVGVTAGRAAGTAGYYSMISLAPRGRHVARVCVSAVCRMRRSKELLDVLAKRFGVEVGGTTADGRLTLETTQCLGGCAGAPCMTVDDRFFDGLTAERAGEILAALAAAPEPPDPSSPAPGGLGAAR